MPLYSTHSSGAARSAICSLQQSFRLAGQLQHLPKAVILPISHGKWYHRQSSQVAAAHPQQQLLDWSFEESQQHKQQQEQLPDHMQQQKQQTAPPTRRAKPQQQQQRSPAGFKHTAHLQHSSRTANASAAGSLTAESAVDRRQRHSQQPHKRHSALTGHKTQRPASHSSSSRQQQTAVADDYVAAQQQMREILVSADINNPLAAAAAIPDTVNDIVISLQILATAPKPATMRLLKQYEQARLQLTAAVVQKLKALLLSQHQQQQQQGHGRGQPGKLQQQGQVVPSRQQQQRQQQHHTEEGSTAVLTAALAGLPPTKLAAGTFALGVLRHYDTELVPALEAASGQIMQDMLAAAAAAAAPCRHTSNRGRTQTPPQQSPATSRQPQQQQQQIRSDRAFVQGFNANQLGQLVQGFVYLDHDLRSKWQQLVIDVSRRQLKYMKAQQLASLAVFLMHYRYNSSSSSSGGADALGLNGSVRGAGFRSHTNGRGEVRLDAGWMEDYLAAAAAQPGMKPSQLVPVMQAVASMYNEWQQQQQLKQQEQEGRQLFEGLLLVMPSAAAAAAAATSATTAHSNGTPPGNDRHHSSSSSSSSSSVLIMVLLHAFQQQLPDLKMDHLAALLPALAAVTQTPWTAQALLPLLLQVRLLMPAAAGPDVAAVAAAVVSLGAVADIRSDCEWCDAYLHRLHAIMTTLGPSDLASTARTLSHLRVKPYKAWRYEFCTRLRVEVKNMNGQEVVATLEGLAKVRLQLDPEVLHQFVLRIRKYPGFLTSEDMKRLVRALNDMYRRPGGRTVLPGRTVQEFVDEVERRIKFSSMHTGMPL